MSHHEIYEEIAAQLQQGKPVVQATIIQTKGSTPRREGSHMLIKQDGQLVGTVGGGCGEAGVIQKARLSLVDGKIREETADLTEDIALESEAVCGGTLRVFIQPWLPCEENRKLAAKMKDLGTGEQTVVVHHVVQCSEDSPLLGKRVILDGEGNILYQAPELAATLDLPQPPEHKETQLNSLEETQIYSERWDPIPSLVIVGAGHIAEPLEQMGRMLGFRTVVVDDRTLFANRQRFPDAGQVVCGPILKVMREIHLSPHHYLVLVTRGHTLDMDALKVLIDRTDKQGDKSDNKIGEKTPEKIAYVGMIGSKRRINAVYQLLEEEGYTRSQFEQVFSPIGLNIGAETPAEIAISVLAEMTAVKRGIGDDTLPLRKLTGLHPSLRRALKSTG